MAEDDFRSINGEIEYLLTQAEKNLKRGKDSWTEVSKSKEAKDSNNEKV